MTTMATTTQLFFLINCFVWSLFAEETIVQIRVQISKSEDVDRGRLTMYFDEVLSDSRCPRGSKCIIAGEAKVRIQVAEAGQPRQSLVLALPSSTSSRFSDHYSVQLIGLDPYPESGGRKNQSPSAITLILRWTTR